MTAAPSPQDLRLLSHIMHSLQGTALLATALVAGYSFDRPGNRYRMLIPAFMIATGLAALLAIPAVIGGWNAAGTAGAMSLYRQFYFLAAVSLLSIGAGLSEAMLAPRRRPDS